MISIEKYKRRTPNPLSHTCLKAREQLISLNLPMKKSLIFALPSLRRLTIKRSSKLKKRRRNWMSLKFLKRNWSKILTWNFHSSTTKIDFHKTTGKIYQSFVRKLKRPFKFKLWSKQNQKSFLRKNEKSKILKKNCWNFKPNWSTKKNPSAFETGSSQSQ